jgi:uncharacterized alkaline shock family protein YloU
MMNNILIDIKYKIRIFNIIKKIKVMTVQELIDDLLTVKDKSIEVVIQGVDPTDYVYYNVD